MTFSTRRFDPLTPLAPKFPNFAIQILLFRMKHTVAVVTHAHVLQNFYTTWVQGVACQRQRLGPKLEGAGLGEHPKMWDPLRIFATVEASNFKFCTQLGFGTSSGPKMSQNVNYTQRGTMEGPKAPSEARRREAPECREGWGLGRGAVAPPQYGGLGALPPENFEI